MVCEGLSTESSKRAEAQGGGSGGKGSRGRCGEG